jgi:hypothetical protein
MKRGENMTIYEALTAAQNIVIENGKLRKSFSMKDELEDIDTIIELSMLKMKYCPTDAKKS